MFLRPVSIGHCYFHHELKSEGVTMYQCPYSSLKEYFILSRPGLKNWAHNQVGIIYKQSAGHLTTYLVIHNK